MDRFDDERFTDGKFTHTVFKGGSGPAVIVMHEAAGLSPGAVALGRRLIDAGFTVHLPMFFGRPEQTSMARGLLGVFCVRREFSLLRLGCTSPVASWVCALARHVHDPAAGPGVGVVGMCLTGGLALASVIEPKVHAAVSAHPALPTVLPLVPPALSKRRRRSIDLSAPDLERAAERDTPVLALRFRHDRICPPERLQTVDACFRAEVHRVPEDLEYHEVNPRIPRSAHSVLTAAFVDRPDHPTSIASRRVVAFLSEHLQPGGREGDSNPI
jgi:dienelactone hydrolase